MIKTLNHIAIISSTEESINFYKELGFNEVDRLNRGYDSIVYLFGVDLMLEIYLDASHPPRVDRPEAMGLRHMAFTVDSIEDTIKHLKVCTLNSEQIREDERKKYLFIKDPDGLPIELCEIKKGKNEYV